MVMHIGEFECLREYSNLSTWIESRANSVWENHKWSSLMQLNITKLVYNELIDEGRWTKAPTFPSIMQISTRITDFDLNYGNWSITENDWLHTV